MKNVFFCIYVFILLIGCDKKASMLEKQTNIHKTPIKENVTILSRDEEKFKKYLAHFKDFEITQNSFSDMFYYYLSREYNKKNIEINKSERDLYLKSVKYSKIYYGFKSKLNNDLWILVYYLKVNELNEMDYFKFCIYDRLGRFRTGIDIEGTDVPENDPVYNLSSKFIYNGGKLSIMTNEYYYDVNQPFNDSIVSGEIRSKEYVYDNRIQFLLKKTEVKEAKFIISTNKFNLAYLKFLE